MIAMDKNVQLMKTDVNFITDQIKNGRLNTSSMSS